MAKLVVENIDRVTHWRISLAAAHAGETLREYVVNACKQRIARSPLPRKAFEYPINPAEDGTRVLPFLEWLHEANSETVYTLADGTTLVEEDLIAVARHVLDKDPRTWHTFAAQERLNGE